MIASVYFTSSVFEKVAPLDQLERFDGPLIKVVQTGIKNTRYYVVIKSQNKVHKLRLCSYTRKRDVLKTYQGQSITVWTRPQFDVFYWTKCVIQMKFGPHLKTDYSAYYSRALSSEKNYPQRLRWDIYRVIGFFGFFGFIWLFYRTPELINQRKK